jgi:hypothetical protein
VNPIIQCLNWVLTLSPQEKKKSIYISIGYRCWQSDVFIRSGRFLFPCGRQVVPIWFVGIKTEDLSIRLNDLHLSAKVGNALGCQNIYKKRHSIPLRMWPIRVCMRVGDVCEPIDSCDMLHPYTANQEPRQTIQQAIWWHFFFFFGLAGLSEKMSLAFLDCVVATLS